MQSMSDAALTVMTYNVGNGLAPAGRLVSVLRSSGADVVGLQELDAAQAFAIQDELLDVYPHQSLYGTGFSGRGLLSRWPVAEQRQLYFAPDRPDLHAIINIHGVALTIIVAHPPPPRLRWNGVRFDAVTADQIDQLAAIAIAKPPAILLGDFNMTVRHPAYAQLTATGLTDAFEASGTGRGATFPTRPGRLQRLNHRLTWIPLRPSVRVDYIWHTSGVAPRNAWVGENAGSDHLPVLARLAFESESSMYS